VNYTCPATGKPTKWVSKVERITADVQAGGAKPAGAWHLIAGIGGTHSHQVQDVHIIASDAQLRTRLMTCPRWDVVHNDLQGLTPVPDYLKLLRGKHWAVNHGQCSAITILYEANTYICALIN
jgi:hypothetical protein